MSNVGSVGSVRRGRPSNSHVRGRDAEQCSHHGRRSVRDGSAHAGRPGNGHPHAGRPCQGAHGGPRLRSVAADHGLHDRADQWLPHQPRRHPRYVVGPQDQRCARDVRRPRPADGCGDRRIHHLGHRQRGRRLPARQLRLERVQGPLARRIRARLSDGRRDHLHRLARRRRAVHDVAQVQRRLRRSRRRLHAHPDPPHHDPDRQHLGQPGAQLRCSDLRQQRQRCARSALGVHRLPADRRAARHVRLADARRHPPRGHDARSRSARSRSRRS